MPEARRTLVKSPPELWAEISDPENLARHLAAFGAIRITEVEPETTVAWEGDRARGTVELAASGWGTKVTLTAQPVEHEPVASAAEPAPSATEEIAAAARAIEAAERSFGAASRSLDASESALGEEPPGAEESPPAGAAPVAVEEAPAAEEAPAPANPPAPAEAPAAEETHRTEKPPLADPPTKKPGLFSRMFRGRRKAAAEEDAPVAEEDPPVADEERVIEEEPVAADVPVVEEEPPVDDAPEEPVVEEDRPAAEALPVEVPTVPDEEIRVARLGDEEAIAVLDGVLDTLGAAHHRPFSR